MLESTKIQRRQSEIREALASLVGKENPTEDEARKMGEMDAEYRTNETRYRASLIAEDDERREAKDELETRSETEWADMLGRFELRQAALALDEGRALDGATAEIVQEMRSGGGYRGIPVPIEVLEMRAGETIASGTPDPVQTRPIIDRLFPASVAARMGAQMISIPQGETEWPVTTSSVTAGWAATETGAVGSPVAFATTDKALKPDHTLGVQMKVTRKALKQSGAALEQAIRRDLNGVIAREMDKAVFLGAGSSGEPLGVIQGASTYGITETPISGAPTWTAFRAAIARFMLANAASSPGEVRILIRPEYWNAMDDDMFGTDTGMTEWDRFTKNIPAGNIAMTPNSLDDIGTPDDGKALLTTNAGGVSPILVGQWGGIDLIRDPYSDAASGGLRLTALVTMDVQVPRAAQLEVLTAIAA